METRRNLSELVRSDKTSLWVGLLFWSAWAMGLSAPETSLPSEVASLRTLCQLSPSASP